MKRGSLECGRLFPGGRVDGRRVSLLSAEGAANLAVLRELATRLNTDAQDAEAQGMKSLGQTRDELRGEVRGLRRAVKRLDALIAALMSERGSR